MTLDKMAAHMTQSCCTSFTVLFLFFVVFVSCGDNIYTRKLKSIQYNPGCNIPACKNMTSSGGFLNLIHIEARGPQDSLHYIASSIETPVVIIAKTVKEGAKLIVNWEKLLNGSDVEGSVSLDQPVTYSMGMVITKMIEFNDTKDKANFTAAKPSEILLHNLTQFNWENSSQLSNDSAHLAVFNASWSLNSDKFKSKNGSLNIKLKPYSQGGRPKELPRLEATANMTLVEFELDNFTSNWNGSRYAFEIVMLLSDKDDPTKLEMLNSIDDEHTPGVFEIINWRKNSTTDGAYAGYMQWKPVCYLSHTRGRSTGTRAKQYDLPNKHSADIRKLIPEKSIAVAFFGKNLAKMTMNVTTVSFGLAQDKFYVGHNYTVWTASIGYGTIPVDTLSLLVIVIILVGLGLPFVLMVAGAIFLAVRRRSMQSQYQTIQ